MKKLFATAALLVVSALSFAQSIPNNGFESWSPEIYYQEPNLYYTANLYSFITADTSCVQKTPDHFQGQFGCRMETFLSPNGDTLAGMALTGTPTPGGISGGVPFNIRADSIFGFFKHNIMAGDTGMYAVLFKNNGALLGMAGITFTGVQTNYTLFKGAVSWLLPFSPDTAVIILSSSNLNDHMAHPGSILIADSLFVSAGAVKTSLPNGNFENWTDIGFDEPNGWNTSNFIQVGSTAAVTASNDAHSGLYACRIESSTGLSGDTIALVSNGEIASEVPSGGMQVWLNPDVVSGYYKYAPVGGPDSALVLVMTHRFESTLGLRIPIDSVLLKLPAAATYTPFQVQLTYNNWPYADSVCISFSSSNITNESNYIGLGSELLIDDLGITYKPAAVKENDMLLARVWPVPAKDVLHLTLNADVHKGTFSLSDLSGRTVLAREIGTGSHFSFSLQGLKPGMYSYTVKTAHGISSGKISIH